MAEFLKRGKNASTTPDPQVQQRVAAMLANIATRGEGAVREYSESLDRHNPRSFRLNEAEVASAVEAVPAELRAHIDAAAENVRAFAQAQLGTLTALEFEVSPGQTLGQRLIPVDSIGAYIPGGRYPLISSALMSILTAKIAGVERVVSMTAPTPQGGISPPTVYAMTIAGANEIYALGGVQAMAAMAYGALDGLDPVDMIVGAGNAYVAEAKRQLFGTVGIDLLAGPTEVLVIADDTADPYVVAVDLLAQAEHGPTSPAVLITTSRTVARQVIGHIETVLQKWSTGEVAATAWREFGAVVVADSPEEAVSLSDSYASEHLQIQVEDSDWYLERLRNYGSAFVGAETTVAYGDKAVGTNHTLPTNRAARYTGGLWVGSYIKVLTYQRLSAEASARVGNHVAAISRAEGLVGHAASADLRVQMYGRAAAVHRSAPE